MLPDIDLSRRADEWAVTRPDELFLSTPSGRRITYAQLREQSGRIAAALLSLGVVPGERVAAQVEKSVEGVLLYVACLRIGAVFVPINVANTPNEVDYFLRDARPRVAVVRPSERARLQPLAAQAHVEHLETLGIHAEGSLMDLADRAGPWPYPLPTLEAIARDGAALAAIVYTSGTTGRSKGAMLTRANLASNASILAEAWHFSGRDVLLHVLPLFHIHGLFAAINTALMSGSSLLLLSRFDAEETLRHFARATVFMGVPTHYTRLLQQTALNAEATAGIRLFVSGSAPLLADTHQEFLQRTGHVILERYGMTETLMNTSNPYEGVRLAGSVGRPLVGTSLRVRDAGGATASLPNQIGTLEVKGPNVFAGYWRDAQKTHEEFTDDGWFKTGDLGRIDSDGYVHIVGRAKDLVISGGYNVYPKEVEGELDALPEVLESAVFGVPHPDFGEGVTAVIVLRAGAMLSEEKIIAAVQARLARYKVPKRVLAVEELPRNAMGKVQKNALRKAFESLNRIP